MEPSPFLTGGSPFVPAVAPVAAVARVARVPAVRANRALGIAAVAAIPGVPGRAAVAGVAAIARAVPPSGPVDLEWWSMVTVGHVVDRSSLFPFALFCRRGLVALDRCSVAARADATSRVRATAESVAGYLRGDSSGVLAPVVLARLFRRTHHRVYALPDELRSGSFNPDELEMELMDDVAYAAGDAAKRVYGTGEERAGVWSSTRQSLHRIITHVNRILQGTCRKTQASLQTVRRMSSIIVVDQILHQKPPDHAGSTLNEYTLPNFVLSQ